MPKLTRITHQGIKPFARLGRGVKNVSNASWCSFDPIWDDLPGSEDDEESND